jgi:hypothetical protein
VVVAPERFEPDEPALEGHGFEADPTIVRCPPQASRSALPDTLAVAGTVL